MAITTNRYLILFLLFIAAAISYVTGFASGFMMFVVAGVIFESFFWMKLLSKRRRNRV